MSPNPGDLAAGPAIARTIELAAQLAALTARTAGRGDLAQQARVLAEQAEPLGVQDAAAYREFLQSRSEEARRRTIELPLEMAGLAADTAELAVAAAASTDGAVGGDARVGVLLAEAAARAAALLVRANGGGEQAEPSAARAAAAAGRVGA